MEDQPQNIPPVLDARLSPDDNRDIKFAQVAGPVELPKNFELDISDIPVLDQKQLGACVGHGGAGEKDRQEKEETKTIIHANARFLYALCKMLDGNPEQQGTFGRMLMQVMKKYGCATTKYYPNDTALSHGEYIDINKIPAEAWEEAKQYKIEGFASVNMQSLAEIKAAILKGGLLVTQYVDENWWTATNGSYSNKPEDLLPLRPPKQKTSLHFTLYYGWKTNADGTTTLKTRNSWTDQWANKGNGEVVYEQYKDYLQEGWTAIDRPNNYEDLMQKNIRKITHILVHHSATAGPTTKIEGIDNGHRLRNWGTDAKPIYAAEDSLGYYIQYHYVIDWAGKVTKTREDWEIGWHGNDANPFSIGICLFGWFDPGHDKAPSEAQVKALTELLKTLSDKYKVKPDNIVPHRKYADHGKMCYGTLLSDSWARDLVAGKTPKAIPYLPYFEKKGSGYAVYDPDTDKMIGFRTGRAFKALFGGYDKVNVVKVDPTKGEDWIRPLSEEVIDIFKP